MGDNTDDACSGNPGPDGWADIINDGQQTCEIVGRGQHHQHSSDPCSSTRAGILLSTAFPVRRRPGRPTSIKQPSDAGPISWRMSAFSVVPSGRIPTAQAWRAILALPQVAQPMAAHGMAHLSANLLRRYAEPRLLVSFDAREKLPPALRGTDPRHADYTILATSFSSYALVTGDGWYDLPAPSTIVEERWSPDALDNLQTLCADVANEAQAIHVADATGILEHFTGEDRIRWTMSSRERAGPFSYLFNGAEERTHLVQTDGVQIEIDRGGETAGAVYLIEAKKGRPASLNIRQLYYPVRAMSAGGGPRRQVSKPIVPLVLLVHNRAYTLLRYTFDDLDHYHSLRLVAARRYVLAPPAEPLAPADLLDSVRPVPSRAPVPTGDPDAAIAALEAVADGVPPEDGLPLALAAGLLKVNNDVLSISPRGDLLLCAQTPEARNTHLARALLRHPVLHTAFARRLEAGALAPEEVEEILARASVAAHPKTTTEIVSLVEALVRRPYAQI